MEPLRHIMLVKMKTFMCICAVAVVLAGSPLFAQTSTNSHAVEGGVTGFDSVNDWLRDKIDPDALRILDQMDDKKLGRIFSEMEQAMSGTNIYQLGELRETARECIPLLKKYDETAAYGDWLQSQMDYLDAAQALQGMVEALNPKRGKSFALQAPSLKIQRQYWMKTFQKREWTPLAKKYIPRLKRIFAAEHLPEDLAWVAEVESAFNPDARSPAGAAGLFQLMPDVARQEQLSLWPWDERFQADKNARAAARFLRGLHDHYGNWELALAAYNAGPGLVDRLVKHLNARNFDAIAASLPAETQMYVPKIEATIWKREGHDLRKL